MNKLINDVPWIILGYLGISFGHWPYRYSIKTIRAILLYRFPYLPELVESSESEYAASNSFCISRSVPSSIASSSMHKYWSTSCTKHMHIWPLSGVVYVYMYMCMALCHVLGCFWCWCCLIPLGLTCGLNICMLDWVLPSRYISAGNEIIEFKLVLAKWMPPDEINGQTC